MKTLLAFFSTVILLCSTGMRLSAQDSLCVANTYPTDEITVNYGRASIPGTAMVLGAVLGTTFSLGSTKPDEISTTGALSVDYFHYFDNWLGVGCAASFEIFRLSWLVKKGQDANGQDIYGPGESTSNIFLSLMPAVKFRWLRNPKFGMYSKLCAGALYQANSNTFSFAMQASPIGMEFGAGKVRGFLELGCGMEGLLIGGVCIKL